MGSRLLYTIFFLSFIIAGCSKKPLARNFITRKVVLVSVDGPRWSETWGSSERRYIVHRSKDMLPLGTLLTKFSNNGHTYTSAGHTAMLTGVYQALENSGKETPDQPNIFQCWRWAKGMPADKAWIVSSKDKIEALADCLNPDWRGKFLPMTDCGVNGLGTGYRNDSITFRKAKEVFSKHHPVLTMVHFREPDYSGHGGNWEAYLQGIRNTDRYVWELWNYLQADPEYAGVTTMIITNDHGRHKDGHRDGFISHGDGCDGCRHIELMILGPDTKKMTESGERYELIDVPSTIAALLQFPMMQAKGKVMEAVFSGQ